MTFNAEKYLDELNGGKKRRGSCNNKRKKKSCRASGCVWSKRSKNGSKGHCRKPPRGSRRRSSGRKGSKDVLLLKKWVKSLWVVLRKCTEKCLKKKRAERVRGKTVSVWLPKSVNVMDTDLANYFKYNNLQFL